MVYAEWSSSGATVHTIAIYDAASGGKILATQGMPGSLKYGILGPVASMANGTMYWLEVTASNADGTTTSDRYGFTPTAATSAEASVPTVISASGMDHGAQWYAKLAPGGFRAITFRLFTAATGSEYVTYGAGPYAQSTPVFAFEPVSIADINIANGTTYYLSAITVGNFGFGEWTARVPVTPVATPLPPGLKATAGQLSAALEWTTPLGFPDVPMTITGYRIDYTTDQGASWTTAVSDTASTDTSRSITGLDPAKTYRFRVAAIVGGQLGGWSQSADLITPLKATQTLSWSPSNTSVVATAGTLTPNALATTNGDGAVTYSVASAGMTGCTVNSSSGVLSFTGAGTCRITATAAQTATYAEGTTTVDFTITRATQAVSWSPSNTSVVATAGTLTPNALATTNGDGAVTYSVASAGMTGCTVNSSSGVLSFTGAGTCRITATAAQTATYAEGTTTVDFTITAPPAPSPGGGGGGSSEPTPAPSPTPEPPPSDPTEPAPAPAPSNAPVLIPNPSQATAQMIAAISPQQIGTIDPKVFSALPPAALRGLTPAQAANLTTEQVNNLRPAGVAQLRPATVAELRPNTISAMRPASVAKLRPAALRAMSRDQIGAIRPAAVTLMTPSQIRAITPAQVSALTTAQLRAMTPRQIKTLSAQQRAALSRAQRQTLGL